MQHEAGVLLERMQARAAGLAEEVAAGRQALAAEVQRAARALAADRGHLSARRVDARLLLGVEAAELEEAASPRENGMAAKEAAEMAEQRRLAGVLDRRAELLAWLREAAAEQAAAAAAKALPALPGGRVPDVDAAGELAVALAVRETVTC